MVSFHTLFTDNQLRVLGRNSMRGSKWGAITVKKALQLRFTYGSIGNELLQQQFPLPSLRTLRRKMQDVGFEHGVLDAVFNLLQLKVQQWKSQECDCCLTLDEMAITPSAEFDQNSGSLLRDVTLQGHTGYGYAIIGTGSSYEEQNRKNILQEPSFNFLRLCV